jgi:hypothetical protein
MKSRYVTHARALGHSFTFCGRDARHNADPVVTSSLVLGEVDCRSCHAVAQSRSLITRPLPLPDPRVHAAKRGAA